MTSVTSDEVRKLAEQARNLAYRSGSFQRGIYTQLDRIADEHRWGICPVICEDGADSDDIRGILASYGSESFAKFMYGD